ncbi:GNAT family N-acetyltransferase [Luteibacter aegosomatis]|uniref:GNAT family N-acetyltransferase n=1 Tax=Luteibacter aegosomatis TaxID=2911537 RepID=UPI001FF937DC|nr:GNAT family N-acetyltransferase [Luteibacter aegosomatis]UPG84117.1 GNAT family N-acetyltransferase [Luteibacter aegosomatis]
MNVLCSTLHSLDELRAMRDDMAAVAEQAEAASSIVQHPDWLAYEVSARDDGTTPYVVVAHDEKGRLLGYAPLLAAEHTARLDLAGRRLRVYRGTALRLLGTGVVAGAADRKAVGTAIARQLTGEPALRVIRIQEARLDDSFAAELAKGRGFRAVSAHLREQTHWTIDPHPSSEAWLASLDKKKRTDLVQRVGRAYRKLGGDAALHVFDTPEAMPAYCRLINEAYARTWHHDALPIDWEAPARVELFRRLAASGQLIGHVVLREGRPLAYVHGYRISGTYLVEDLGYDEAVAKAGIGSVAVFQAIRGVMDRCPGERISFGYGDNQYKRVLASRGEPCGSLYIVRSGTATAGFHMYAPARWLYRGLSRMREVSRAGAPAVR